jgi:hypothetical protein
MGKMKPRVGDKFIFEGQLGEVKSIKYIPGKFNLATVSYGEIDCPSVTLDWQWDKKIGAWRQARRRDEQI